MTTGEDLRDEGVDRVLKSSGDDWKDAVYSYIYALPVGWEGTGEDIRVNCPPAHHPNAWGAIIATAIKREWLEPTGGMRKPRQKLSHARRIYIYRRTDVQ